MEPAGRLLLSWPSLVRGAFLGRETGRSQDEWGRGAAAEQLGSEMH